MNPGALVLVALLASGCVLASARLSGPHMRSAARVVAWSDVDEVDWAGRHSKT